MSAKRTRQTPNSSESKRHRIAGEQAETDSLLATLEANLYGRIRARLDNQYTEMAGMGVLLHELEEAIWTHVKGRLTTQPEDFEVVEVSYIGDRGNLEPPKHDHVFRVMVRWNGVQKTFDLDTSKHRPPDYPVPPEPPQRRSLLERLGGRT